MLAAGANLPKQAPDELRDWIASHVPGDVAVQIAPGTKQSEFDDYIIEYEVVFSPSSIQCMSIAIFYASSGYWGVGIEPVSRVLSRFGRASSMPRYSGGFEPCADDFSDVVAILDAVRGGELSIGFYRVPMLGVTSVKVMAEERPYRVLSDLGDAVWLTRASARKWAWETRVSYQPWSRRTPPS